MEVQGSNNSENLNNEGRDYSRQVGDENRESSRNSENARQIGGDGDEALKMNSTELIVGDVRYSSVHDAAAAREELKKINYIESRMNYNNPEEVLAIYNKMIENKLFVTPTGYGFLFKIRHILLQYPGMDRDRIYPVVTDSLFTQRARNEARASLRPPVSQNTRDELKKVRNSYRLSVIIIIFLVALVIALFAIALSSDNPNILNYRTVIENQYSQWEESLSEREKALKEKEKQMGMESTDNGED